MPRGSPWPERDEELRALWMQRDPQLSTKQIGDRMKLTKNAVVGRVHRLGLPSRPSPIQLRGPEHPNSKGRAPRPMRAPRQTLAPTVVSPSPTQARGVSAPGPGTSSAPAADTSTAVLARVAPSEAAADRGTSFAPRAARPCRFPLWGDKERPTHRYCDAPSGRDGIYCAHHRAMCWRPFVPKAVAA